MKTVLLAYEDGDYTIHQVIDTQANPLGLVMDGEEAHLLNQNGSAGTQNDFKWLPHSGWTTEELDNLSKLRTP